MKIKLDEISFMNEINILNINYFPKECDEQYFSSKDFWNAHHDIPYKQKIMFNTLEKSSLSLKKNEEQLFFHYNNSALSGYSIFIVSSSYIIQIKAYALLFMDNQCNFLFGMKNNLIYNNYFDVEFSNKKTIAPIISIKDYNFKIKIKSDNTFKIDSSLGLSALAFKHNQIDALFKSTSYSSMKLDYNYNILEVEINKNLKKKLNLDSNIKYTNIKDYDDLMSKINVSLEEGFDFYALLNDSKLKLNGTEAKFDRDFRYIKEITTRKDTIFQLKDLYTEKFILCYNYYKPFVDILNMDFFTNDYVSQNNLKETPFDSYLPADISKGLSDSSKHKLLALILLIKKNDIKFVDFDVLNVCKEITGDSKNIINFSREISDLKLFK